MVVESTLDFYNVHTLAVVMYLCALTPLIVLSCVVYIYTKIISYLFGHSCCLPAVITVTVYGVCVYIHGQASTRFKKIKLKYA